MPIAFSVAALVLSIAIVVIYWNAWSNVALQFAAMPFFLLAGWSIARSAHPNRPRFRVRNAALILGLASVGMVLSAIGTYGGSVPVSQWWAGIALAATLVSIAPYCSPRMQLICAVPLLVVSGGLGWIVFSSQDNFWTPAALIIIASGPVFIAAAASVVFSYSLVSRTLALLETTAGSEEAYPVSAAEDAAQRRSSVARMSARVVPFLTTVATAGVITPEDRALAAQLARRLRAELVTVTTRSWLDVVASETGTTVSDPSRLAESMNESQRAALRGLLMAATDSMVVDRGTLLIELREQPDGATAVALSIDVDLPEGRRLVLLAPYYLTLKNTVQDLSWNDGHNLLMRFTIPPAG
jgi:hypothetical protein